MVIPTPASTLGIFIMCKSVQQFGSWRFLCSSWLAIVPLRKNILPVGTGVLTRPSDTVIRPRIVPFLKLPPASLILEPPYLALPLVSYFIQRVLLAKT